jgi:hypothetical protein
MTKVAKSCPCRETSVSTSRLHSLPVGLSQLSNFIALGHSIRIPQFVSTVYLASKPRPVPMYVEDGQVALLLKSSGQTNEKWDMTYGDDLTRALTAPVLQLAFPFQAVS